MSDDKIVNVNLLRAAVGKTPEMDAAFEQALRDMHAERAGGRPTSKLGTDTAVSYGEAPAPQDLGRGADRGTGA